MIKEIPEINIKEDLDARVEKLKGHMNDCLSTAIFKVVKKKVE